MSETYSILIDNKQIDVHIIRSKKRRSIGFIITGQQEIQMRIPYHLPKKHIVFYLKQKEQWIIDNYQRLSKQPRVKLQQNFHDGGSIHLLGKDRMICFILNLQKSWELKEGRLVFYMHHIPKENLQETYIKTWLKEFTLQYFTQRTKALIDCFEPPLAMPDITIRKLRKSWGSMRPNHKMTLAQALIHLPPSAIDHVILHELCHMIHFNHSAAFVSLLKKLDTDYVKNKEILKQYSLPL